MMAMVVLKRGLGAIPVVITTRQTSIETSAASRHSHAVAALRCLRRRIEQ
jgi:hypothetical protein